MILYFINAAFLLCVGQTSNSFFAGLGALFLISGLSLLVASVVAGRKLGHRRASFTLIGVFFLLAGFAAGAFVTMRGPC